ncbi:MAG: hypothetical protein IJK61_04370 [Bacteroidetes bacterium]|nr:hypothetical protein [Bacteroidota bacterium]
MLSTAIIDVVIIIALGIVNSKLSKIPGWLHTVITIVSILFGIHLLYNLYLIIF